MKVRKLTSGLLDRPVLVDRHYVKNSGKLSNITGIVSVMVGITKGPNWTTEIVVIIKGIMQNADLVLEMAEIENK